MKITEMKLYLVDQTNADYGPGRGWSSKAIKAHPMSVFSEYKNVDHSSWVGPLAYKPFVVELETDVGVSGFAVNHGGGLLSCALLDKSFRRFIVGKNPLDHTRIWEQMYRAQLPTGQGGISYMAISALDLALWDLRGKLFEQPVYNLIGGATKEALHCYVTTHPSVMEHMANKGFRGVKLSCPYGPADGRRGIDEIEAMVIKARDLFGGEAEVMIECYMSWDRDFLLRVAKRLEKYEVKWFEDPLHPDVPMPQYAEVARLIKPAQIALGNQVWGQQRFHGLINEGAADIIQPELQWAGGLTEALRIGAMARGQGKVVIPHSAGVYSYHFGMAHMETPYSEYYVPGDGIKIVPKGHILTGEPAPVDGYVTLSDEPGFGVGLNRDLLIPFEGASLFQTAE